MLRISHSLSNDSVGAQLSMSSLTSEVQHSLWVCKVNIQSVWEMCGQEMYIACAVLPESIFKQPL